MTDRTEVTIKAVQEALDFIESTWQEWDGDFHEFMANVISDDTVSQYEVQEVLDALSVGEPIQELEGLIVQKKGSSYKIKVL